MFLAAWKVCSARMEFMRSAADRQNFEAWMCVLYCTILDTCENVGIFKYLEVYCLSSYYLETRMLNRTNEPAIFPCVCVSFLGGGGG